MSPLYILLALRAKLFVARLIINHSLQGVGTGVDINYYNIVPKEYKERRLVEPLKFLFLGLLASQANTKKNQLLATIKI